MKRHALILLGLFACTGAFAQAPAASDIAIQLLDRLDAHDYSAAESAFGEQMAAAVPADKLAAVWESLPAQAGAAQGRGTPVVTAGDGVQLVVVPLHYAKAELVAKVVVDTAGRIIGFLIQPAAPPAAAPVAADAGFVERDFSVGEGARALPGTLAMPDRAHPPAHGVPAVVLVHGSGAMDRDETIGPNRPFLDIARGLAAQGIAVLRYEKRSKARPQDFASGAFTIDDETTDDAVAAVAALRATKGIDPARVFVFGHSQGAMMAPRIAAHSGHVAGLVLLAAPARPLLDILVEQNVRLAVLDDGSTSPQEAAAIATLKQQVAAVRAGGDVALQQSPLHQPATYWRSTDAVHPVDEARAVARPMLLLQGARDIQVVDADWQAWKQGLHADRDVAFRLYPTLNHLGIAVGDNEGLAGYSHPGHVDAALIKDVAEWIRAH
jgi:dienelactone hydrolase